MPNLLGRQIPLTTARKGGYFFVMRQDGVINKAVLDLGAYVDSATAPTLPNEVDWSSKAMDAINRMYKNDQLGCCVISSAFHEVGVWTANAIGTAVQGTDAEVVATYRIWNPRGDNGCDIGTVLQYTRDHGIVVGGQIHKIDAYISIDNTKPEIVKAAIALGFMVKLGIDLPGSWEQSNDVWDVTNSRVVGGHDVPGFDYGKFTADGVRIATWGGRRTITWPAFTSRNYITECYGVLSSDWYAKANASPNNIDLATLKADLDLLKNGQVPSVGPPEIPLDWIL